MSEGFWLMEVAVVPREPPPNRKVPEARLTILSNQDVVLGALSISMRVLLILHFAYRTDATV